MSVVNLNGTPITVPAPEKTPLAVLQDIVAKIESGELALDKIFVIGESAVANDLARVIHPVWDSGLTCAETVFLLETAKADIFELLKR